MMKNNVVSLRSRADEEVETLAELPSGALRERALTAHELFQATDSLGRRAWWLRLCVTGLYPRRFGPFGTGKEALKVLDRFLDSAIMDALCGGENELSSAMQYCVIEDDLVQVQTSAQSARATRRRSSGQTKNAKRKGGGSRC